MIAELVRFARLGTAEIVGKVLRGEVQVRDVWMGLEGSARFVKAIAEGDVAEELVQVIRAGRCARCEHRVSKTGGIWKWKVTAHYCGEPLRGDAAKGLCGCIVGQTVAVTVDGKEIMAAAGKTQVGSEGCGLGKW